MHRASSVAVRLAFAARLPWLVRELWEYNFSYADEDFLRNIVELATLIELREIKHRSRIKVDDGVTLYGIMDETGFLQEGQIHCTMHNDSGAFCNSQVSVVITRLPCTSSRGCAGGRGGRYPSRVCSSRSPQLCSVQPVWRA